MSTETLISISNKALSRVGLGFIQDLAEGSVEADHCAIHLPQVLEEVAEWSDWPVLVKRSALAVVTNDRPAEWLHAYAAPADLADPLHVRSVEDAAETLPTFSFQTLPLQNAFPLRFIVEGDKVYTNVETATLVYTSNAFDLGKIKALTRRAIIDELAVLLALGVKRDAKMAQLLRNEAEVSRGRAIADAQNRNPKMQDRYISEAELARAGLI